MATARRESVLDSAHWTMAVGVVLDFLVSMAEAMVRVPRYMGTKKQLATGLNAFTTSSLCNCSFCQSIAAKLLAVICRNLYVQEEIFQLVSLGRERGIDSSYKDGSKLFQCKCNSKHISRVLTRVTSIKCSLTFSLCRLAVDVMMMV